MSRNFNLEMVSSFSLYYFLAPQFFCIYILGCPVSGSCTETPLSVSLPCFEDFYLLCLWLVPGKMGWGMREACGISHTTAAGISVTNLLALDPH